MKSHYHMNLGPGSLVYQNFQYPAGEFQVRILPTEIDSLAHAGDITITARLTDGNDLMRLALLSSAVRGVNSKAIRTLRLPYLPYARADRRFVVGDCFGLEVFGSLINRMAFDRVVTLDAHSAVAKSCIDGLVDVSPLPLIEKAILRFSGTAKRITVLFPDEGARERYTVPRAIGCNVAEVAVDVLHCAKKRDAATGALSGFTVPPKSAFQSQVALIVDDICDGGGTFLGIADALKTHTLSLGLYVSHGIFSKGFGALQGAFRRIYTTNSITENLSDEHAHQFECEPLLGRALTEAR